MSDTRDRSPIGFGGRRLLGHYLVGRRIAEGGMGAVHLADVSPTETDCVGCGEMPGGIAFVLPACYGAEVLDGWKRNGRWL